MSIIITDNAMLCDDNASDQYRGLSEHYEFMMDNARGHVPGVSMTSRDTAKSRIYFAINWVIDVLGWGTTPRTNATISLG